MKFDFRRLTPAVLTSLGLVLLALLFASFGWFVLAWVLGLAGIALNVTAVAVTEIDDRPADRPGDGTRRVSARPGDADRSARERMALRDAAAPDAEIEADAVRDADGQPVESTRAAVPAPRDGKPGKGDKSAYSRAGSTAVPGSARPSGSSAAGARE